MMASESNLAEAAQAPLLQSRRPKLCGVSKCTECSVECEFSLPVAEMAKYEFEIVRIQCFSCLQPFEVKKGDLKCKVIVEEKKSEQAEPKKERTRAKMGAFAGFGGKTGSGNFILTLIRNFLI